MITLNEPQTWTAIGVLAACFFGTMTLFSTLITRTVRVEVGSLRNEMNSEIGGLRQEMIARFEAVDARFEAVDARFDAVDARFEMVNNRIDHLDRDVQFLMKRERDR